MRRPRGFCVPRGPPARAFRRAGELGSQRAGAGRGPGWRSGRGARSPGKRATTTRPRAGEGKGGAGAAGAFGRGSGAPSSRRCVPRPPGWAGSPAAIAGVRPRRGRGPRGAPSGLRGGEAVKGESRDRIGLETTWSPMSQTFPAGAFFSRGGHRPPGLQWLG